MIEAFASHPELFELYESIWGHPSEDVRVQHQDSTREFHVLTFEDQETVVARVVTLGLGTCESDDGVDLGFELIFVIGRRELCEIGSKRVADFVADIATHLLRHSIAPVAGSVILHTSIAPWDPDAMVFDVARGEPEALEDFVADGRAERLVWAIPAYADEALLVQQHGIEALDALVEQSSFSLADVCRPSLAR